MNRRHWEEGTQRMRWMQEVTGSTGRIIAQLNEMALDRSIWKRLTHEVIRGMNANHTN